MINTQPIYPWSVTLSYLLKLFSYYAEGDPGGSDEF